MVHTQWIAFYVNDNNENYFSNFCIEFIDFILEDKNLLDYTKLFSLNDYKKDDRIILKYFQ